MASLNTLRTKGSIFLTIVIMLALLAFILSDLGSCQPTNPKVGEIAGNKITYTDFENERHMQELMLQGSNSPEAYEMAYNRAWQSLVMQLSLRPGLQRLGVSISEAEQIDMVSGIYLSPVIENNFRNPQTGVFDPEYLAYFVSNIENEKDAAIWRNVQQQMTEERLMSKYFSLVTQGLNPSALEIERAMAGENNTFSADIISLPYSSIPDSVVNVTPSQIRDHYKRHKNRFRSEPSREIEYVVFGVEPSGGDIEAARAQITQLGEQLRTADNPVSFAMLNSPDDKSAPLFVRESDLPADLLEALVTNSQQIHGPVFENGAFTVSRLAASRTLPDSVSFRMIQLTGEQSSLADSLVGVLRGGANFSALATQHSRNPYYEGGEVGAMDPAELLESTPALGEALISGRKGEILRADVGNSIFIVEVGDKLPSSKRVKIASLKLVARAGSATQLAAMNLAREFYDKATSSGRNFSAAASEMAIPTRMAQIASNARSIDGLENSLRLVRWAFNNKRGAVSEPEEMNADQIVVAQLTNVNEGGFTPLEEVSSQLKAELVTAAKGEMLAGRLAGTDLNTIASTVGAEIVAASDIRRELFFIPGVGMEMKLIGAITSETEAGRLSRPVKGVQGVYLYQVTSIDKSGDSTAEDQRLRFESMSGYYLTDRLMDALYQLSDVKDHRARFF